MTIEDIAAKGGPVVWILFGYSLVALSIVLERAMHLLLNGRPPAEFESDLLRALARDQAAQLLAGLRGPEGILLRALLEAGAAGIRDLGRVAVRIGSRELRKMERGFRTLGLLGNTAPLLGLLGTVLGMIDAFMVIEQAGGRVDAQALAGGIWEAMLTTGVGLAVAVPILLMLHFLEGVAERRAATMRACASLLIERLQPAATAPAAVGPGPEALARAV